MKFRADTTAGSPACASTRAPPTPAPTSATSGRRTGTLLATATFTNETASGWQQVTSPTRWRSPPNTTYVASYHAPRGNYAVSERTSSRRAPSTTRRCARCANGEDGGNGVYAYGPSGSFPTGIYSTENYWVDVVFDTSAAPTPRRRRITGAPAAGRRQGVPAGVERHRGFNEPMSAAEHHDHHGPAARPGRQPRRPPTVTYDAGARTAILDPAGDAHRLHHLHRDGQGRRRRRQGPRRQRARRRPHLDVHDGRSAAPPPDEGPGGPILVHRQGDESVLALLRRDPAHRRPERVHRQGHLAPSPRRRWRATTS